jgi:plasmid stabilization system protein ParE
MKVIFTLPARRALDGIYEWYKSHDMGKNGRKIRAAIVKRAMLLKSHPNLGQEEENLRGLGLGHRYLVESNYKFIYRVADNIVIISDIFDTRQDPEKMKP